MCGISCLLELQSDVSSSNGAVQANGAESVPLADRLNASLDAINHRGPDSRGHWISDDGRVGLGHARLSINDLSPTGSQPFHSPDNKIHAVVNGELYNDELRLELQDKYAFKGTSDCEIVMAAYLAYGEDFITKLRGEFALVIWDEEKQLFLAARDRYGIKPLFYSIVNEHGKRRFLIAAEAKAMQPLGWKPAWDVRSLVQAGWNFDDRTAFKGVRKVKPGHVIRIEKYGEVVQKRYWDMEFPDKREFDPRGPEEMIAEVRERLLDAVRVRLKADVKVGIYLSGGIDSSVLAGMVNHLVQQKGIRVGNEDPSERLSCFSIAFDEDTGFDESDIANRTAEWLGVKYHKIHMNEAELARRMEDATYHCEHHFADLNYIGKYALSELPPKEGFKVVLTGEGADEIFAGYPMYVPDYLREPDLRCSDNALTDERREELLKSSEDEVSAYYNRLGIDSPSKPTKARTKLNNISTPSAMVMFQPTTLSDWAEEAYGGTTTQDTVNNSFEPAILDKIQNKWHPLHSALYVWSKHHLLNLMLSCLGDRTEMAHSLEARTPFLDHNLTEYVAKIAPSFKLRWCKNADPGEADGPDGKFVEKWILREASRPFITDELYKRTKHPYTAPDTYPANGPMHQLFEGLLTKENVENLGFVSWDKVGGLVDKAFNGQNNFAMRQVIMVGQWIVLGRRFGCERAVLEEQDGENL